ncbi:MAG: cell division protein FtsA [Candidatus Moraniibacteriota bacterium]|nr:MAG: cell division protein FtsA [Candidatus Moranbacteria bacterium]
MKRGNFITGLDIGSGSIRTVVVSPGKEREAPRIVGVGVVPTLGVRRGSIVDIEAAVSSIVESISRAESMAGAQIERVSVALGGHEVFFREATGVIAVGKADGEVLDDDINRVLEQARHTAPLSPNQEILHIIPKHYRLDDEKNIKDPLGMNGVRLEVSALLIGDSAQHTKNISRALEQAGIGLEQFVVSPLAASEAVLGSRERELGAVLVDIGADTTSLAVFEEGDLLHVKILPIGAGHITNDIAIGLRTSIDVAEAVKVRFGSALSRDIDKKEDIDLAAISSKEEGEVSRRHIAEIIEARLEELFQFVDAELKQIGRSGLLPGGVVLSGGGARLPGVVELAKETLRLPAHIGYPKPLGGVLDQVDDPEFATVLGLVLWAEANRGNERSGASWFATTGISQTLDRAKRLFGKFLP